MMLFFCCSEFRLSQCDARGAPAGVSVPRIRASGKGRDGQQPNRHRHNRLRPAAYPRTRKSDNDDISRCPLDELSPIVTLSCFSSPAVLRISRSRLDAETDSMLPRFTDTSGPQMNVSQRQLISAIDHRK